MPDAKRFEKQFFDALRDIFVGAKVEGESGFINLMRIKSRYYEQGVFPRLREDINAALKPFPDFREELFDKLYTFFQRYFSESGSIYFRYTSLHQNIYERVYTDDRDVILFWKTHMLYYVKTDRIFISLNVEVDGVNFFFDASKMVLKKANEKRETVYTFVEVNKDGTLVFDVAYSEKGKSTKVDDILKAIKQAGQKVSDETLTGAFRVFEKQSEVDYFINKDARAFLQEQFDLWMYHYLFSGQNVWAADRLAQLQVLKAIAYKVIDFISQFEDELVKIWNKPKFVRDSHYIITLDKITDPELLKKIFAHKNMKDQLQEWRDLGMVDDKFKLAMLDEKDVVGEPRHPQYRFLPLDTKYFPDLELGILALFDDLDAALDGWLVHSENYQALNTLLHKYQGLIDVIYIDPPYNTDAGPIDYVNTYRSASWLSLIENRLVLAQKLLSPSGISCVTIDDYQSNELANLLNEKFGKSNQLGVAVIRNNPSGRSTVKGFSICHEYAYFFQNSSAASLNRLPRTEKQLKRFTIEDGVHVNWQNFRKGGGAVTYRKERPKQFYPIYVDVNKKTIRIPGLHWDSIKREWDVLESPVEEEVTIWPIDEKGNERIWSFNHKTAIKNLKDLEVRIQKDGAPQIYRRHKPLEGTLPRSWWDKNTYAAREHGSAALKHLFGESTAFSFAKSPFAVQDSIWVAGAGEDTDSLIMDFFAGSGTTAQAVMNLNRSDGGQRKYILVEMGAYFNTVILPRIKKLAFYSKWKNGKPTFENGESGISHFVKYYDLEQYEDAVRRARYADADLFDNPYEDPYHQYVFLRDLKMLDGLEVEAGKDAVHFHPERIYEDIDLAETLSHLRGKWIKRITKDEVEFQDGERLSLTDPDWRILKPMVWWQ